MRIKRFKINTLIVAICLLFTIGCEDFLNKQPLDMFTDASVFQDQALATAYLYKLYNYSPVGYMNRQTVGADGQGGMGEAYNFSQCSDEARNKSGWPSAEGVWVKGTMSPTNDVWNNWNPRYEAIRKANNIILGLETSPINAEVVKRMSAEARILRAVSYFELTRRFGAVPLITSPQSLDDDLQVAQTSQADIYKFIIDEVDAIIADLPDASALKADEYGRMTKEAAWAYQSRAALYAKNYAKCITACENIINKVYHVLAPDYEAIFPQKKDATKEVIFEVLFQLPNKYHGFEFQSINSLGGEGQWNPTQELVDEYYMKNGLKITDPASGFDPANPYANRDPRLAATVVYHGQLFRGKTMDMTVTKQTTGGTSVYTAIGIEAPKRISLNTVTGYYLRKHMDYNDNSVNKFSDISWKEVRYAEILLNYAEAKNEIDATPSDDVYAKMDLVRNRAGLPNLKTIKADYTKDEMRDEILHERWVELAWENQRYWDLVRHKRLVSTLNGESLTGMFYIKDISDPANILYYYEKYPLSTGILGNTKPAMIIPESYYLIPIPQAEMDKNSKLIQNPGYLTNK